MRSSEHSDVPVAGPGAAPASPVAEPRRPWLVVVGAAVVVVVVVVAAVVAWRRDDPGWSIEAAGGGNRLVADERTVCGTNRDELLFCLDAATGEELFTERMADWPEPVAIVDGTVLVGDRVGIDRASLHAYSREGDLLWEARVDNINLPEAPVADGVVAVGDDLGTELAGLDVATGEERWRIAPPRPPGGAGDARIVGRVLTDGRRFYVTVVHGSGFGDHALVAVDPRTGEERWRSEATSSDPQVHGLVPFDEDAAVGLIVGQVGVHLRIVVLDTATGRLRWQAPLGEGAAAAAHVDGVTVALVGRELRAYDGNGDELWVVDAPTGRERPDAVDRNVVRLGRLFVAGGVLYFHSGHLLTIDPATGEVREVVGDVVGDAVVTADFVVTADTCCGTSPRIEAHPR